VKPYTVTYEARGADQLVMLQGILATLDKEHQRLADVETASVGDLQRITFPLTATNRQHDKLRSQLCSKPGITQILAFPEPEDD
jgi:hypothetical protein